MPGCEQTFRMWLLEMWLLDVVAKPQGVFTEKHKHGEDAKVLQKVFRCSPLAVGWFLCRLLPLLVSQEVVDGSGLGLLWKVELVIAHHPAWTVRVLGWCCGPASVIWAMRAEEMQKSPLPSSSAWLPSTHFSVGAPGRG